MSPPTSPSDLQFSSPLPVTVGNIGDFAHDPVVAMRRLWATHGEIAALQEDAQRLHFVFGPEYIRQVLSDSNRFHSRFFAVRGARHSAQRRITSGLLSMNGDEHRQHRRIVMGPFQKKAIVGYHDDVVAQTEMLLASWRPGEVRDMNAEMTRYMLQLTSRILFGLDDVELACQVGELTERWVALNHQIGPAAFSSNPTLAQRYDELLVAAEELEVAVKEMIARRRAGRLGHDVLSILIRMHDQEGGISDDQLIGHITLLFGAAHLTSAHTLTWTLLLLAQHPEVMEELHAELSSQLGGEPPSAEQLDQLTVLDRVLKESMRVLPASAYSQRLAAEAVSLGPFQLNPGSVVIFSQFITHHMPELYPQPERFLPDRWLSINPSPYAYFPFGSGPRMCIGAALGMMQLRISLATMLSRFKFQMIPDAEINGRVMSTMLYPTTSVPMLISRPDGRFSSASVTGNIHTLVDFPPAVDDRSASRRAA